MKARILFFAALLAVSPGCKAGEGDQCAKSEVAGQKAQEAQEAEKARQEEEAEKARQEEEAEARCRAAEDCKKRGDCMAKNCEILGVCTARDGECFR